MDITNIYLIRCDTDNFVKDTLVRYISCTYSGDCYLVADLKNDKKREWIMYYDLYPVDWIGRNNSYRYYYDENTQQKANQLLAEYKLS